MTPKSRKYVHLSIGHYAANGTYSICGPFKTVVAAILRRPAPNAQFRFAAPPHESSMCCLIPGICNANVQQRLLQAIGLIQD